MEENHELRKVYNYEFTCPNCKELINSLKTKEVRTPFYCWKCAAKLPLDLKIRRWEEMEVASMDDYVEKPKCRPKKFEEISEEHRKETLGKIELKIKMLTEEYTCPSCAYHHHDKQPFREEQPTYCTMCGAKLPLNICVKRTEKWIKTDLLHLADCFAVRDS